MQPAALPPPLATPPPPIEWALEAPPQTDVVVRDPAPPSGDVRFAPAGSGFHLSASVQTAPAAAARDQEVFPTGAVTRAVGDPRSPEARPIGRLTGTIDGRVRYCTATVIAERLLLTAAHCVHNGPAGKRVSWLVFEPHYSAGESSGVWTGTKAYVPAGWADPRMRTRGPHDYALVRLSAPIAAWTGTADVAASESRESGASVTAFGYPRRRSGSFGFDGRFLYASKGPRLAEPNPGLQRAGNGLTEGSSGGPWRIGAGAAGPVVGLNSMKPPGSDDTTWSPLFGDGLERLIAAALADMTGV